MAESLTLAGVVETLVDLDLVDLFADGPWPPEPHNVDVYEPDWTQVHPTQPDDRPTVATGMPIDTDESPWSVFDEVKQRAGEKFMPPPDVIDVAAWYAPVHYFGLGMAIYIRESAVFDVAAAILSWLEPREPADEANIIGACRAAMSILYLHEAFHHKIESFTIRCEIVERARRYLPYSRNVYVPLRTTGSDDLLEEALASAEMYRRFKTERLYHRGIPGPVREATIKMLGEWIWFQRLPPSYRRAWHYLRDGPFADALNILMSQVQDATIAPKRGPHEWDLAPHMHRGLFNCQRITHILVPVGQKPLLPWIGHAPPLPSISSRQAVRGLEKEGWEIAAGRGKGSHIRLRKQGRKPLTIPANRESLSPGILGQLAHALGVRVADLRF